MLARAAMRLHHEYPEITSRKDALLWSINERLGVIAEAVAPGRSAGGDLDRLDDGWIPELWEMARANAEDEATEVDEAVERARQERAVNG